MRMIKALGYSTVVLSWLRAGYHLHTAHAGSEQWLLSSKMTPISGSEGLQNALKTEKKVSAYLRRDRSENVKAVPQCTEARVLTHVSLSSLINTQEENSGWLIKEMITSQTHSMPWRSQWAQGCQWSSWHTIFRFPKFLRQNFDCVQDNAIHSKC